LDLNTDKEAELHDMKLIFQKIDLDSKQQEKLKVFSMAEITHYVKLVKE